MPLPPANQNFTFKLIGFFENNIAISNKWRHSMEIFSSSGAPSPTSPIVTAIVAFWESGLRPDVTMYQLELRYWTFGKQTDFHGSPIWVRSTSSIGAKGALYGGVGGTGYAGSVVALIEKDVGDARRKGHSFLRGWLDVDDVDANSGDDWKVKGGARITDANFQTHSIVGTLDTYFGSADPGLTVVRYNQHQTVPVMTPILGMHYVGPITAKSHRRSKK